MGEVFGILVIAFLVCWWLARPVSEEDKGEYKYTFFKKKPKITVYRSKTVKNNKYGGAWRNYR